MKTAGKCTVYFSTVVMVILFLVSCSGTGNIGEVPPDAVCKSLVNTKCTRCHYKTRICDALGTKSASKWEKTIQFMIRQGADLTDEERNKVLACLSSLPQGSQVVCD
jgi:hypothetical protein